MYMYTYIVMAIMVRIDDLRTERVNEEILLGRKHISMQQINQLLHFREHSYAV